MIVALNARARRKRLALLGKASEKATTQQRAANGMSNPNAKGRIENLKNWPKGVSGNPSGVRKPRPPEALVVERVEKIYATAESLIIEDLREAAKKLTGKAVQVLELALDDVKSPMSVRLAAAREAFDRGWGKPTETVKAEVGLDLEWLLRRGRENYEAKMIEGKVEEE